jgi:hypothetical protein
MWPYLLQLCLLLLVFASPLTISIAFSDDEQLLQVIARTGPQGAGSVEARAARDELAQRGVELLPPLLTAMDTDNPVAANWYRTIYEEIIQRQSPDPAIAWPMEFLRNYVSDPERAGKPRRLVLKLIDRLEPDYREQWLSGRLTDPEFRTDAVEFILTQGKQSLQNNDDEAAVSQFRSAFEHARNRSQVIEAADRLKALGQEANVIAHLGLVTNWWIAGPFDAPDKSGFGASFPPEAGFDPATEYTSQRTKHFGWKRHTTTDPLGQLNLVNVIGKTDEAVAYAWTEITVEQHQDVQLRCSADDCCLVWVNGAIVSSHEQWLNGTRFDRFIDDVSLKTGRNQILVKVCQGPQHRNPEVFNNWSLQLRLCDADGRGIMFENTLSDEGAR